MFANLMTLYERVYITQCVQTADCLETGLAAASAVSIGHYAPPTSIGLYNVFTFNLTKLVS